MQGVWAAWNTRQEKWSLTYGYSRNAKLRDEPRVVKLGWLTRTRPIYRVGTRASEMHWYVNAVECASGFGYDWWYVDTKCYTAIATEGHSRHVSTLNRFLLHYQGVSVKQIVSELTSGVTLNCYYYVVAYLIVFLIWVWYECCQNRVVCYATWNAICSAACNSHFSSISHASLLARYGRQRRDKRIVWIYSKHTDK